MKEYHFIFLGLSILFMLLTLMIMGVVLYQRSVKVKWYAVVIGVLGVFMAQPFLWIYAVDAYRVMYLPELEPTGFALKLSVGLGALGTILGCGILGRLVGLALVEE